jgi:hypothetical protein
MTARGLTLSLLILLAAASPASGATSFVSPSGNIGCAVGRDLGARCDIRERTWSPPPKPSWCPGEWGNGLTVGKRGLGRYTCANDTVFGGSRRLAYGESIRRGRFVCKSMRSGMRCVNSRNGHGFKLSREIARLF